MLDNALKGWRFMKHGDWEIIKPAGPNHVLCKATSSYSGEVVHRVWHLNDLPVQIIPPKEPETR